MLYEINFEIDIRKETDYNNAIYLNSCVCDPIVTIFPLKKPINFNVTIKSMNALYSNSNHSSF